MKSNTFNINRFTLQLRRDLNQYRTMLLILYSAILIPYLLIIITAIINWRVPSFSFALQREVFLISLVIITLILAATSFKDFRSDLSTQNYILLPSSSLEKFLSMWIIVYIITPIGTILSFEIINNVFILISKALGGEVEYFNFLTDINPNHIGSQNTLLQIVFYTSIYFAGAASFKKDAWLKTTLTFWLVSLVIIVVFFALLMAFVLIMKLYGIDTESFKQFNNINIFDPRKLYTKIIYAIGLLVFWAVAYFKITEKQV